MDTKLSPTEKARDSKNGHKKKLSAFQIAEKRLNEIVTELIIFSNREVDIHIKGLRAQIKKGITYHESEIERYRAVVSVESSRLQNTLEQKVAGH